MTIKRPYYKNSLVALVDSIVGEKLGELEDRISDLEDKVEHIIKDIEYNDDEILKANEIIEDLSTNDSTREDDIKELQNDIARLEECLDKLENDVEDFKPLAETFNGL